MPEGTYAYKILEYRSRSKVECVEFIFEQNVLSDFFLQASIKNSNPGGRHDGGPSSIMVNHTPF